VSHSADVFARILRDQDFKQEVLDRVVARIGTSAFCWDWLGSKTKSGYGTLCLLGRPVYVHRLVIVLNGRDAPADGMMVLHSCDNPGCCNPDHLSVGTAKDNSQDMASKGRQFLQQQPNRAIIGEAHKKAKLTEADVRRLRWGDLSRVTQKEAASILGVGQPIVSSIKLFKTWKHVCR
jgi:predicted DNA-binding protein (UPF0251 family)